MSLSLHLDKVDLFYDHVHALKSVSLALFPGETVALIGANGAGKSSILRAITGLTPISSGVIYFGSEYIHGMAACDIVKKGIAMVPEGRRVFPYMSVKDNLLMGAFSRTDKQIKHDIEKVSELFPRLKERFTQAAGTLSGGEQQMMVIARALMARPKLLLLDEPSLGIAPKLVQDIARSIVRINREEGLSVLLVEQNSRLALSISHRAYAMTTGSIVIEGNSKELLNDERIKEAYLGAASHHEASDR